MNDQSALAAAVRGASLQDFVDVAGRIRGDIIRTPLLPCTSGSRTIRLKAECLQPLGSFKIRPAASVLRAMDADVLQRGVATASAGNFAQGLGLAAKRRGISLTVHAPDSAAKVKLEAIRGLGARIVMHSFADWWSIMTTRETGADDGVFIHPVREAGVILGNGSIGLELAEDWPEMDTVVIPFGGGGLSSGIALALRALSRKVRIVACEVETSTALTAAFAANAPVRVERLPSFVDGIGSNGVLEEMWPLVKELIDDVVVVTLPEVKAAVRELALRHHLIAEGAGAAAYAAALSPRCKGTNVAAVITGGNIDPAILGPILTQADA
jgi:threonine dehydratase